ncbi:MAG: hypothetical protein L7F77_12405 [Candidatus Magnetominusculus sp. LBB02]|nr:hypothetical protein [Candidatus Magnetominusculus sp. LBB02]
MKRKLSFYVLILSAVLVLSSVAFAGPPLRDHMISSKLSEARGLLTECINMRKIAKREAISIRHRIDHHKSDALRIEIRHRGTIPPADAQRIAGDLDSIIRELKSLRAASAPHPPHPGPQPGPPGPPPPP